MSESPRSTGARQARSIRVGPFAVASSPVGAPGAPVWSESLRTALVKLAASLPAASWTARASSSSLGSA